MTLPNIVRTKAEATRLAAEIIPSTEEALAALLWANPKTEFPRYALDFRTADRLREVLLWLAEQRPRLWKRARFYLLHEIAWRAIREADANGQAKVRAIYAPSAARTLNTYAMGDGDGI